MPPAPAAQERRRRVAGIRRTVAVLAVSAFLALWSGLFVQLRSGHDPALGTASSSTSSGGSSASSGSSGSTSANDDASAGSDGTDATTPSTSDSLPPATTSQS
jgi:hypothetical protein